ncbi:hypothetical protein D3C87_2162280 [compost metagenome]
MATSTVGVSAETLRTSERLRSNSATSVETFLLTSRALLKSEWLAPDIEVTP